MAPHRASVPTLLLLVLLLVVLAAPPALAGPAAYGICQSGCNVLAVACFAAAGVTFGATTVGVALPAAALGCTKAQGLCMVACIAAGCAPTP